MIKRTIFIVFGCLLFCIASTSACDVCGSSASNMGVGLMTDYRSNFIRFSYFNTPFTSKPEHEYLVSDEFIQMSLSIRFALDKKKRIRLMAHLPYGINTRNSDQEHYTEQGLSDLSIYANYSILNNLSIGAKTKLFLEVGGGLNLPTGKYDEQIPDRNLPENFNIGKGAVGYIFQMNTILNFNKSGVVLSNNFQLNSKTQSGYHFGNQLNSQLTLFRELNLKQFKLIPNAGLGFESTTKDQYANGNSVSETGGKGFFFSSALNFKSEKWLAGFTYSIPLVEDYSQGDVIAKGRIACQVSFIF